MMDRPACLGSTVLAYSLTCTATACDGQEGAATIKDSVNEFAAKASRHLSSRLLSFPVKIFFIRRGVSEHKITLYKTETSRTSYPAPS